MDDGIYTQLAEGVNVHPLHSIYPPQVELRRPPLYPLPSKTSEIQLPAVFHIAPLPFSLIDLPFRQTKQAEERGGAVGGVGGGARTIANQQPTISWLMVKGLVAWV